MIDATPDLLSVTVERDLPHQPEKVWRALTERHLIEEWLMKTDFKPIVGHRFRFSADWGAINCEVLAVEQNHTLSYTWAAPGLETVAAWTLIPTSTGTRLRMEQSGFRKDQPQFYEGAKAGWPRFFGSLEQVLARADSK
jgi:uncharacterized protein YndB with AHSA1/START domain